MQIGQLKIICPMVVGLMMATGCATEKPQNGLDAAPCTAVAAADGSIILNCPDSEPITIRNGMDGASGTPGNQGTDGDDADPCSVTDNNDGTITIDCPDGTSVTYNVPLCGNGELEAGEECDDANEDNSDSCLSTCMEATCGDGYVGPNEYCDGNLLQDFQCDATCGGFMCAADFEIRADEDIGTYLGGDPLGQSNNRATEFTHIKIKSPRF